MIDRVISSLMIQQQSPGKDGHSPADISRHRAAQQREKSRPKAICCAQLTYTRAKESDSQKKSQSESDNEHADNGGPGAERLG